MDDRMLIDELRALLAGSLSSEEAERVRERCAADPELRAILDEMAEAHALTEPAAGAPPPCRLTFEEVESSLVPQRVGRMVLRWPLRVVAAVLVFVLGGFALSHVIRDRDVPPTPESAATNDRIGGEAGRPLILAAIPPGAEANTPSGPEIPAVLADYRPVEDGEIQWIESLDTAKAVARACSRPVLLFLHHPTCPWCIEMRGGVFEDAEVLARIDGFVPALVSVLDADPGMRRLARDGWPWLGAVDADGKAILSFPGLRKTGDKKKLDDLLRQLDKAADLAGPPVADWLLVNAAAGELIEARSAEEAGDYAAAYGAYNSLAGRVGTAPFSVEAVRGIRRIGEAAREALIGTRSLAEGGAAAESVVAALDGEIRRFEGTPYAADFAMVRDHVSAHAAFPTVASLR